MLFQPAARRYERGSIIVTSNKAFSEWGAVLNDEVLATAILDRLVHHCDVLSMDGPATGSSPGLSRDSGAMAC